MIEVKNLVKRYGEHLSVDHLSFTVEEGQIYGFLGPNGAGKSTTMNIISGYISATEGEIIVNGHNILEEPEQAKRCIGYLPELPPLYMDMTVMEYLVFVAELKKIKKEERASQIKQVLELTHLEEVEGRLIRNLSKGYRQRVGLAQAILGFPEIIILDEPTVGLDPKQIIEIRELIQKLSEKHTIIFSSHILSEIQAVCDHILIINHGKLLLNDTKENLEEHLQGKSKLNLVIKGTKEQISLLLNGIEEINNYTFIEKAEGEEAKEEETYVALEYGLEEDLRETLFYACADAKLPILMMKEAEASLEQVFLELTSDERSELGSKQGDAKTAEQESAVVEEEETEEQNNESNL